MDPHSRTSPSLSSDTATAAVPAGHPDPLTVAISIVTPSGPRRSGAADAGAASPAVTAMERP
jgi:hypothetical protein